MHWLRRVGIPLIAWAAIVWCLLYARQVGGVLLDLGVPDISPFLRPVHGGEHFVWVPDLSRAVTAFGLAILYGLGAAQIARRDPARGTGHPALTAGGAAVVVMTLRAIGDLGYAAGWSDRIPRNLSLALGFPVPLAANVVLSALILAGLTLLLWQAARRRPRSRDRQTGAPAGITDRRL